MSIDLSVIEERVERAEYAAIHICNNSAMWHRYYSDTVDRDLFINDFKQMVREISVLRNRLSEAHMQIEALGGKVDERE